ncbi:hypothetical protein GCM10022383_07680 [Microbacterium soli]|uniref:Uncharacterized protein n=1 Tax=Microbacterium soli TaxID=446075 RepID=A0ABP7MYQ3_9MICO
MFARNAAMIALLPPDALMARVYGSGLSRLRDTRAGAVSGGAGGFTRGGS